MKRNVLVFLLFHSLIQLKAQQSTQLFDQYFDWPVTALKNQQGQIILGHFYYNTPEEYLNFDTIYNEIITLDDFGNILYKSPLSFGDTNLFPLLKSSFNSGDSIALVFEFQHYDSTRTQLGLGFFYNGTFSYKAIPINIDGDHINYCSALLNSKGNIVTIFRRTADVNGTGTALYISEINPKDGSLIQNVALVVPANFSGSIRGMVEVVADSAIVINSSDFKSLRISNQNFGVISSTPKKYDTYAAEKTLNISDSEVKYLSSGCWTDCDANGFQKPGWSGRLFELFVYKFDEHYKKIGYFNLETDGCEVSFDQPFRNNLTYIDSGNIWGVAGIYTGNIPSYQPFDSEDLERSRSSIGLYNFTLGGKLNCFNSYFGSEENNYYPWHIFPTPDAGAIIIYTVHNLPPEQYQITHTYAMKVNSSCQLTSIESLDPESTVSIWPNPTSESLHFDGSFKFPLDINVTDVLGKIIKSVTIDTPTVEVTQLPCGQYFIEFVATNVKLPFVKL